MFSAAGVTHTYVSLSSIPRGGALGPRDLTSRTESIYEEMHMITIKHLLIASSLAVATVGAYAQATPGADQRQENQQKRIEAGEQSGALTPHEANRMERQQKVAGKVESNAKADGVVTPAERAKIHKVEKKTSKDLREQKHDAQTN